MSDAAPLPTPPEADTAGTDLVEVVSVVFLGIAAILTAVAAFQASLKGGEALNGYTESNRLSVAAADLNGQGDVIQANDEQIFLEWIKAVNTGQEELAAYLQTSLMTEELAAAIQWWADSPDGVYSPFVPENPSWTNTYWDQAAGLEAESEAVFVAASEADDTGDEFQLAAVFFAVTLFFGGIANVFKHRPYQVAILAVAGVALAIGAVVLVRAWV